MAKFHYSRMLYIITYIPYANNSHNHRNLCRLAFWRHTSLGVVKIRPASPRRITIFSAPRLWEPLTPQHSHWSGVCHGKLSLEILLALANVVSPGAARQFPDLNVISDSNIVAATDRKDKLHNVQNH